MRHWLTVSIVDCGEPLVAIPADTFAFTDPHPYATVGAPYGGTSPWLLRQGVVMALVAAQSNLTACKPGWKLKLFDTYPGHYAGSAQPFHAHRVLLNEVMTAAGFCRHPNEWWHFSLGDQMWAWMNAATARYGRA